MSIASIYSRAGVGIKAPLVVVEVDLARGLPSFSIVGLPETVVKESKDRVRSAIVNSGFLFPIKKIIVNLAPADLPKEGGRFDLAIALGILAASQQIPKDKLAEYEFGGELALNGNLREFKGALPFAIATDEVKRKLILPKENAAEAALVEKLCVYGADNLLEICTHLSDNENALTIQPATLFEKNANYFSSLDDIKGQAQGKRVLTIAAAGGHSALLVGPPGTGKTMLASRLRGLMPILNKQQALEVAAIYSLSRDGFHPKNWQMRPFRSPHHTASAVALVGGGRPPKPGEITLAHEGILFLDELPEFNRHVLEALREPIEVGHISISRASAQVQFPARFQLIAAMNPCPCGYHGDRGGRCRCSREQIQRYQMRLSGPLLDRIDLHLEIMPVPRSVLLNITSESGLTHVQLQTAITKARARQLARTKECNAHLSEEGVALVCKIQTSDLIYLESAMERFKLSARSYHRLIKIARTIADLADEDNIQREHLQEALCYRSNIMSLH